LNDDDKKGQPAETVDESGKMVGGVYMFRNFMVGDVPPDRRDVQAFIDPIINLV